MNLRLINGQLKDMKIFKVDEFINERFLGKTHIETMEMVEGDHGRRDGYFDHFKQGGSKKVNINK